MVDAAGERLYVLGAWHSAGSAEWPWDVRYRSAGGNTGNLLVGHAAHRQLRHAALGAMHTHRPDRIREHFDRIVVVATNFLSPHFDLSGMADIVETADLPCLMVGLGAQADDYRRLAPELQPGTVRFVRAVAERSAVVGVRGEFTASVLDDLGVRNVAVLGCPSFYTNLSAPLRVARRRFAEVEKVVVTGTTDVVGVSFDPEAKAEVERTLFRLAAAADCPYVFQSELAEILQLEEPGPGRRAAAAAGAATRAVLSYLVRPRRECAVSLKRNAWRSWYNTRRVLRGGRHRRALTRRGRHMGYERAGDYAAVVRRIGRVFFDVDEWFDFVRGQHLVVGTRLHGAVAALLQGVPAIVLYHDSRTREICELLGVPRLSVAAARGLSLEAIYDRVDFDELTPRHAALIPRYVDFLERNGVAHRFAS